MRKWIALGLILLLAAGLMASAAAQTLTLVISPSAPTPTPLPNAPSPAPTPTSKQDASIPAPRQKLTRDQLSSYYRGALFIGDSITTQLKGYIRSLQKEAPDFFPDVKFQTAQSYFLYTASRKGLQSGTANLKLHGVAMPMYRILEEMRPPKALILLGVNDYIGTQVEKGVGYCRRILELTAQYAPGTEIIFESLTPVTASFCRKKDYRTMWDEYNAALKAMCEETNTHYIDIATPLKDGEGYLDTAYSNDGKYHLNAGGLDLWIQALLDFAQAQYDLGLWTPEET
ncbi:MAG: SGNH/GDSL hydrolase family protein [Clostridia bacterium]|nr:SGNH/GDSL hydrolase family protein [Clostridia bacterium]